MDRIAPRPAKGSPVAGDKEDMSYRQDPTSGNARVQDRRTNSRLESCVSCSFEWAGVAHDATLLDISLTGALLNSENIPPVGTEIVVVVGGAEMGRPVSIPARVVRGRWGDRGKASRFAVRFNRVMTEVIRVISTLTSRSIPPSPAK